MISSGKVTIGITAYNSAETLGRALESALLQEYPDVEILIVDDLSTDDTRYVIDHFQKSHPDRIRTIQNMINGGVAFSRNVIIDNAQGEFIVFFDDDDVSIPQRLLRQIERIIEYEKSFAAGASVICHCGRYLIYPDGYQRYERTPATKNGLMPSGLEMAKHLLWNMPLKNAGGSLPTCVQAARTSVYKQLGGFDPAFRRSEDTDFNIRFAISGGHFVGVEDALVQQYMTQAPDKSFLKERFYSAQILRKHSHLLQKWGRGDFDLRWLDIKHDYWERNYKSFLKRLTVLFLQHPVLAIQKILYSLPNFGYNNAVKRFHQT